MSKVGNVSKSLSLNPDMPLGNADMHRSQSRAELAPAVAANE